MYTAYYYENKITRVIIILVCIIALIISWTKDGFMYAIFTVVFAGFLCLVVLYYGFRFLNFLINSYYKSKLSGRTHVNYKKERDLSQTQKGFIKKPEIKIKDANAHFNQGYKYWKGGKFEGAIKEYKEAIRINPTYALAHYNLGVAFWDNGQIEKAIEEYEEAIRIYPNYASAHCNLGLAYAKKGRMKEAMFEYREAIRLDFNLVSAHCNLGVAFWDNSQVDEAMEEYKLAIKIEPNHALSHFNLGLVYNKKSITAEAKYHFRRALDLGYERARYFLDNPK